MQCSVLGNRQAQHTTARLRHVQRILCLSGAVPCCALQSVAMHDCLFRNRNDARWVAYLDYDEYLDAPGPKTVPGILEENKEMSFVSHGCYTYDVAKCEGTHEVWDPQGQFLAVERVLTRSKQPFCEKEGEDPNVCLDGSGHRKFFANPRLVRPRYCPTCSTFTGISSHGYATAKGHSRCLWHLHT